MGDLAYITLDFSIKLVIIAFLLHMMIPVIICGFGIACLVGILGIILTTIMGAF